ncbi:hypothetical protein PIB30_038095 [Stylosanthes scabra]|uniref:Retrotransposon Copia-like N-terminal domain-containing protein n=1 Tax=Stylosanthes scabra TaxID=79078 RepID=A0ABU6ZCM3_9FABA|nr:hypothetical protein [Stylosanthes scabra]
MAFVLANSNNEFKSALAPMTDKLDDKNYSTWRFQALLTVQTLELDDHLDPSKTPSPTLEASPTQSSVTNSPASNTGGAPVTPSPTATAPNPAFREWCQHDLALRTWLAASITKPFQNKILKSQSFYEAWTTIETIHATTSKTRIQSLKSQMRGIKKT